MTPDPGASIAGAAKLRVSTILWHKLTDCPAAKGFSNVMEAWPVASVTAYGLNPVESRMPAGTPPGQEKIRTSYPEFAGVAVASMYTLLAPGSSSPRIVMGLAGGSARSGDAPGEAWAAGATTSGGDGITSIAPTRKYAWTI